MVYVWSPNGGLKGKNSMLSLASLTHPNRDPYCPDQHESTGASPQSRNVVHIRGTDPQMDTERARALHYHWSHHSSQLQDYWPQQSNASTVVLQDCC